MCWIIWYVLEREWRISIRAKRAVAVVTDAPAPSQHSHVEVEDASWVAGSEQNGKKCHHTEYEEGQPQKDQDYVVRDGQQPLHQPQPATHASIQLRIDFDWIT